MSSQDAERQELERAVELLGRNTRPARLLEYLGKRYFHQQQDQLTEFNIASEVFGRSASSFDAGQDAVVRVEAHRLRKKLRDIYESGGGGNGLQISLPAGTYVPHFSRFPEAQPAPRAAEPIAIEQTTAASTPEPATVRTELRPRRFGKSALYWFIAIGILGAAVIGASKLNDSKRDPSRLAASGGAKSAAQPASGAANLTEVHLMAGYSGSEVIDNSGVHWTPDRYFSGGSQWLRDSGFVRGTSRQFLFANWRSGHFGYDIPLDPGTYELRLFFVATHQPSEDKLDDFHVSLNGKSLLSSFDVNISAHGADVAEEQVFRDISPGDDGFVRLRFSNAVGTPALNALEITPGTPRKLKPIRITMQPTAFVDHQGERWLADDYFINGMHSVDRRTVTGTDDPEIFGAERFGHFAYAIPVDTRGRYTVILHFAEYYFGPQLRGTGGVGSRIFNVYCNGHTLLENFDIFQEGGSLRVVTKSFMHVKPSAQGKINLTFEPVVNNATVSGIEIIDESN